MPTPAAATLWTSLGTLDSYMDFTSLFSLGDQYISGTIIKGFMMGKLGAPHLIYGVDMMSLTMILAAAAYVVVKSVDTGVSFTRGFYHTYAGGSALGNLIYALEVIVILAWQFWSLLIIIFGFVTAGDIWNKVDGRIAGAAAESIGLDTAVSWNAAIKTSALLMVVTFGTVITAYTLACTSDQLISYFGEYDDDTKTEGDEKTDSSADDADGTSAQWDLGITHLLTTFYAYFVFTTISYGGYIFFLVFSPLDDSNIECDFSAAPNGQYDGVKDVMSSIKDYDSCVANILLIFKKMDINGNGHVERCEDASLQHFMGSSEEYATKYSSEFSVSGALAICKENFDY